MNSDKIRRIEALRAAMPTMASRQADRERIARQLDQFLQAGGQIQQVEPHTTALVTLSISDRAEENRSTHRAIIAGKRGNDYVHGKSRHQANSRGGKA